MLSRSIVRIFKKSPLFKFAGVGGVATLVHAAIYGTFSEFSDMDPQAANVVGFLAAFCFSYVGQRRWTFAHVQVESESGAAIKFFACSAVGLILNAVWVLIVEAVGWPARNALLGICFLTPPLMYLVMKYMVFPHRG
jgi:putative flippase GtrA